MTNRGILRKLKKLVRNPESFLSDSQHPALQRVGGLLKPDARSPSHSAADELEMSAQATSPEEQAELDNQTYIEHRASRMDRDILRYGDPNGKRVLVFGCGVGADVLWSLRHGARHVLGIDLALTSRAPIDRALAGAGMVGASYELRRQNVHDLALTGEKFELIVTNAAFEHVADVKGCLEAFRDLLNPGGRISFYADGLWYSSAGGHLGGWSWDHLLLDRAALKAKYPSRYRKTMTEMNRYTAADFMEAFRSVGLVVLQLQIKPDPLLKDLPAVYKRLRSKMQVSPTDMSISALGCELCFPEHL